MHLVNKVCLNTINTGRLFRLTYKDNLLYINYFNSIYKGWFVDKKEKDTFNFEKTAHKIEQYMLGKKSLLYANVEDSKKKN
jgi:hypothetical protein